jgi:preprotein translocase SecE subunit
MAESKDKKEDKKPKVRKKPVSMRENVAKAKEKQSKTPRIRKATSTAKKPVSKAGEAITREYHLIEQKENPGFFTKSRKLTPSYFRSAWQELRLVTWPDRRSTWRMIIAVFIFSVILGLYIAGLDYVLERIMREVIL